jgi:hypothetical protein
MSATLVRWIAAEDIESDSSNSKTDNICKKSVARNLITDDSAGTNIS